MFEDQIDIRQQDPKRGRVACFGELLYRMTVPGSERFMQSPHLNMFVGGAEANVGVSLAQFDHYVRMLTVVADNPLGNAACNELRRYGVDVQGILKQNGRMGLYFLSQGAVRRPSEVVYDRLGSAFEQSAPDLIDWEVALAGVEWLHVSGVTPAISESCSKAVLFAVKAASELGVKISFDGNYRALLWRAWDGDGPSILSQILERATYAFINERDISLITGETIAGKTVIDQRKLAFEIAFEAFPKLKMIAATTRKQKSVHHHLLEGEITTRQGLWRSDELDLVGVVDRIGGGDAFAAGVLHGLISGKDEQYAVDFGVAAAAIKHSIPGDFNITSIQEVEQAMENGSLDVKR